MLTFPSLVDGELVVEKVTLFDITGKPVDNKVKDKTNKSESDEKKGL